MLLKGISLNHGKLEVKVMIPECSSSVLGIFLKCANATCMSTLRQALLSAAIFTATEFLMLLLQSYRHEVCETALLVHLRKTNTKGLSCFLKARTLIFTFFDVKGIAHPN